MSKDTRFAALVSDVAREVMRRRSSDACCGDLTLEQFETLQAVARSDQAKDQSTIGSLSTALGVDISTMSRNVSVLERNGYLARLRSTDDGRIVHVRLTPRGKKALTNLQCGERDVLADVYEAIPPAEREKVLQALESLRASLIGSNATTACCAPVSIRRRTS
ncbi:MAG: MarR family winged helix-turn-helix transcriptional regulator [Myxococcales bacterium]